MNDKKNAGFTIVVIMLAVVTTLFIVSQFGFGPSTGNSQQKTIVTNGTATVTVVPDIAYINIGVVTEGKELTAAQSEASDKMNGVITSLGDLGVKKEDIKTVNYSTNPKYVWNQTTGQNDTDGYMVNNVLEVKISDISKMATIVDSVTKSGSNQIYGVRFDLKDKNLAYAQVRESAIKDAKAKAEAFANGLGVKHIKPIRVNEGHASDGPVYAASSPEIMAKDAAVTPINSGTMDVVVNVSVEFSYN